MSDETKTVMVTQSSTGTSLAVADVARQVCMIQDLLKTVMKKDHHYGVVPGCGDKPTLLKPGAEKVNFLFRYVADEPNITIRDLAGGHREYDVRLVLRGPDGRIVGSGVGSCSTMESKYRWRKSQRACPKCGVEGSIGRSKFPPKDNPRAQPGWYCRECKAQYAYDDPSIRNQQAGRMENPDIADVYNTCLKMAKKRAYVDATLTASAASDFFTQDIEDYPEETRTPRETSAMVVEEQTGPQGSPESDTAKQADDYLTKIEASQSRKELENLGIEIAKDSWDTETHELLSKAYKSKLATFPKAAKAA